MLTLLPILLYFLFLLFVTWHTARRESPDSDYFLAGRSIHPALALVSVIATETSVATVIIFPQAGRSSGFALLWLCAGFILGRYAVARFYLARLYERHRLSIYATITNADPLASRVLSVVYLVAKFISSGVRFFMGGLALYQLFGAFVPGLSVAGGVALWILVLASFAGLYSLSGGLRAVILTDQLQGYVILGLGLVLCGFLFFQNGTPVWKAADFIRPAFSWSDALYSPVLFLAGFVLTIGSHGADQDMLQRILATKTEAEAKRALFLSGLGATVVIGIYLALGFLLRTQELPANAVHYPLIVWIRGLDSPLLTGGFAVLLFAAAMSTLDSAMHSTGAIWKDVLHGNRAGRLYSFLSLAILVGFALFFSSLESKDFLKLAMGSMNYVNGGLIAVFTLYVFSKRALGLRSILAAVLSGFLVTLLLNLIPIGEEATGRAVYTGWSYITLFSTLAALLTGRLFHRRQKP